MKAFAELFTAVDQTTGTNEKVDALVNYFAVADSSEIVWCIALLIGKQPKRTVKTNELKQWCLELAELPGWLFEESYLVVGDLAETITLSLPKATLQVEHSLSDTMIFLQSLTSLTDEEKKNAIQQRWLELNNTERFVFNKLITGGFRMGVSKQLIIKALSKHFKVDENTVAHRLTGNWDPWTTTTEQLLSAEGSDNHYRPYPFYLAYQLDSTPEELGDVHDWIIERKFDGIRGQLIVRNGALFVWSRGEELMTEKFPEFNMLNGLLPDGTVIDGEVLPYSEGKILPFHIMQTRVSRKNVTKSSLQKAPLIMMCYDLLELNGRDIRNEPLQTRRQKLETLVAETELKAGKSLPLLLSPVLSFNNWDEVRAERLNARANLCEGLMLKHKDSVYETGRRRGKWWKWKIDPLTVDGVLIYAQAGHGRRANLFTDYTFAVWDGDLLVPFTKAYSGLTDKELMQVDSWIKRNTIDKFGPVRSVKPELVFEIAFEGIQRSTRHKSGVALRFPRILRWRMDKKMEEANTKNDLLQLIDAQAT